MLYAYSVFDNKAKVFSQPFYTVNDSTAIRMFRDAAIDPQTSLAKHPEDFSLYAIGRFDDALGLFVELGDGDVGPILLIHAVNLKEASNAS